VRSSDWTVLETVYGDERPSQKWQDQNDDDLARLYHELRLLKAAGCPADREKGNPQIDPWEKYQPAGFARSFQIYVLKTTPARWRLYFYVPSRTNRQIEIIHAVAKKRQKRKSRPDLARCKFILDRIVEGTAECERLFIPDTR
jgi:hypothetical protein